MFQRRIRRSTLTGSDCVYCGWFNVDGDKRHLTVSNGQRRLVLTDTDGKPGIRIHKESHGLVKLLDIFGLEYASKSAYRTD